MSCRDGLEWTEGNSEMNASMTLRAGAIKKWLSRHLVPWQSARTSISRFKRKMVWAWKYLKGPRSNFFQFRCNICGKKTSFPRDEISRECWSCFNCGSNVRWRSVVHALSSELFGTSLVLPDFPSRPDLVGFGMSDWDGYAIQLKRKLTYSNTYYHQEPFLDITSIDPSQFGRYDFIITSDVFEHIAPPVSKAFENARQLLKPGGVMIFTVPYIEGKTREHFPELHQFTIQTREDGSGWFVLNHTVDGRRQEFSEVTFHGGPGSVLEMRIFGKDGLLQDIEHAGFGSVQPYCEECPEYGILWLPYVAENASYRPLIYGLDTPPWALRNSLTDSK